MSELKLIPMYDRILVQRAEAAEQTGGGLFVPEVARDKPQEGTVVAVGCGRIVADGSVVPCIIEVGTTVVFNKYSGAEIEVDGQTLLILREDEVLGMRRAGDA